PERSHPDGRSQLCEDIEGTGCDRSMTGVATKASAWDQALDQKTREARPWSTEKVALFVSLAESDRSERQKREKLKKQYDEMLAEQARNLAQEQEDK
ncbi:unnamed protein product, partial [Amoebophrya sp. A25]